MFIFLSIQFPYLLSAASWCGAVANIHIFILCHQCGPFAWHKQKIPITPIFAASSIDVEFNARLPHYVLRFYRQSVFDVVLLSIFDRYILELLHLLLIYLFTYQIKNFDFNTRTKREEREEKKKKKITEDNEYDRPENDSNTFHPRCLCAAFTFTRTLKSEITLWLDNMEFFFNSRPKQRQIDGKWWCAIIFQWQQKQNDRNERWQLSSI